MKLSKLLLAILSATVLLAALVSSASARIFSLSAQTSRATWPRMNFAGGFGTVECEVVLSGSFHSRTSAKVVNSLIGYITEGSVNRCARGGATINTFSFPWHRRFRSFAGTLPEFATYYETVTGAEWTLREPTFGIACTVRRETSSTIIAYTLFFSGTVARADISGISSCSGVGFSLSGSTPFVTTGSGAALTFRLI